MVIQEGSPFEKTFEKRVEDNLLERPYGLVASVIKRRARELGMKPKEIAIATGYSVRTVYDVYFGRRKPSANMISAIALALNFNQEELVALLPEVQKEPTPPPPLLTVKINLVDQDLLTALEDIKIVEGSEISDLAVEGLALVVDARRKDPAFLELVNIRNTEMKQSLAERSARWSSDLTP